MCEYGWQVFMGPYDHMDFLLKIGPCGLSQQSRQNCMWALPTTSTTYVTWAHHPPAWFAECTILSSLNADVDSINKRVLEKFPGQSYTFHSADYIPSSEQSGEDDRPVKIVLMSADSF
jgi:hypothetical protein